MDERAILPAYEVLAIKYAETVRPAHDLFFRPAPTEGPGALDYYVWLIRGHGQCVLVDTGFGPTAASRRGRTLLRSPADVLMHLGCDSASLADVVLTHLHYDHAGDLGSYPQARFIVQNQEIAGATGRDMRHAVCNHAFDIENIVEIVRLVHDGRVHFVRGDTNLAPGISLHLLGGHTRGLQGVRVNTPRGWVMLASDGLHLYRNLQESNPFPVFLDLPRVLDAGEKALSLADSMEHLIPGHDPLIAQRFPSLVGMPYVFRVSAPPLDDHRN
ncbi:N-acyl homoserine lactonase family protein [Sphingobium fuliginis]|uniref:N-acyl homoserine lactonase family protein n=1 Tax=Sphingobium fuliginis (strain ATCC 27551) TaxID=336203 RepID=UPI00142FF14B|nr:N-acyl homoserine lactonase family protein [Sphingobium fuliginis]